MASDQSLQLLRMMTEIWAMSWENLFMPYALPRLLKYL